MHEFENKITHVFFNILLFIHNYMCFYIIFYFISVFLISIQD